MTRAWGRILAVALVGLAAAGLGTVRAGAAPVSGPGPSRPALPCIPVVNCDPAAALAKDAADRAARAGLDAMVGWVADGAKAVLQRVSELIGATTKVDLTAPWIEGHVATMRDVAVLLVLPLLLVALVGAVIHQDPGRLARTVGVHLPLSVLGMFTAVQLTSLALAVTDELCNDVSGGLGHQSAQSFQEVSKAMTSLYTPLTPGTGGFLAFVAAVLVVAGALLIWLELLLRSTAIYVAVMFLPVVLGGLVWPATARWAKRLVEILVALILSKFVVVAVISLAVGGLGSSNPNDGIGAGLAGAAMLLLAGFAPFALLRLVPVVEATVIGHLEGMSRRPAAAGVTSSQVVHRLVRGAGAAGSAVAGRGADDVEVAPRVMAEPALGTKGFLDGLDDQPPPGSATATSVGGPLDAATRRDGVGDRAVAAGAPDRARVDTEAGRGDRG